MNLARTPQPQPQTHRTPRHRAGRREARPAIELLAAHSLQPRPSDARAASAHHAAPTDEPGHVVATAAAAAALGLDLTELDNLDVYAAASIVRRRAHTAIHRLYRCRPRLRRARRAIGPAQSGALDSAAVIPAVTERVLAVQIAETRLVAALDKLETITNRARATRQARALFYPHGGRLVISSPMHERLAQRQELAENTAAAVHIVARRALHILLGHTAAAERFATSLEEHIEHVLDQAAAAAAAAIGEAPPPILRILRAALPARQRHEWWREICSLFAEATPPNAAPRGSTCSPTHRASSGPAGPRPASNTTRHPPAPRPTRQRPQSPPTVPTPAGTRTPDQIAQPVAWSERGTRDTQARDGSPTRGSRPRRR